MVDTRINLLYYNKTYIKGYEEKSNPLRSLQRAFGGERKRWRLDETGLGAAYGSCFVYEMSDAMTGVPVTEPEYKIIIEEYL